MEPALIVLIVVLILLLIIALSCIRIVSHKTCQIIEFLGKYQTTWESGLHFKIPLDLCQYFGQKKLKDYADFFSSSSSLCCGVI